MRILIALTYYRPHYSGLTIYVERLARALARRGHHVTVLTSRFDPALPHQEVVDGVQVIRLDVRLHISKGVIMPAMPSTALKLLREADLVNVHVPQLDASYIAVMARMLHLPVVMTYHCDLDLPAGWIHRLANAASSVANRITAAAADRIVTNTRDYAENSTFLRGYLGKMDFIVPAVELPDIPSGAVELFRARHGLRPQDKVIGMLARLATEKGVEVLVNALPLVLDKHPEARVLYVGQYQNVLGEEAYARRLAPHIEALGERWKFLGVISPEEVSAFFHACDVTVLPSLNSTESFGMVQVESMSCGTPVVASDLPGVRQPVRMTGMGVISVPGDVHGLAQGILQVLDNPHNFTKDTAIIRRQFSSEAMAAEYERVFHALVESGNTATRNERADNRSGN